MLFGRAARCTEQQPLAAAASAYRWVQHEQLEESQQHDATFPPPSYFAQCDIEGRRKITAMYHYVIAVRATPGHSIDIGSIRVHFYDRRVAFYYFRFLG